MEGADIGAQWSTEMEETGESGKNHQSKMGDYYPATSFDPHKRDMDCFEGTG